MREGWNEIIIVDACEILTCSVASTPKYVDGNVGVPFLQLRMLEMVKLFLISTTMFHRIFMNI